MKILFLICMLIMAAIITCNAQSKSDTPRQLQEGIYLKDGGEISKDHIRCTLVKIQRTMQGNKHLFIADTGDTLYRTYQIWLKVNRCYYIPDLKTNL